VSIGPRAALAAVLLLTAAAAEAQERKSARIVANLGVIGVGSGSDSALTGSLEWRGSQPLFWQIAPLAGALATSDGAAYGYVGAYIDVPIKEKWYFTPSIAVGVYGEGSGKDLGHRVEFKPQAEISYRLTASQHVGLSFYHLSNAGLADRNPGTNGLAATYSVSLSALSGLLP